jgi:site-specific recombinase XerD
VKLKSSPLDVLIDQFLNYLVVEKGLSKKTLDAYSRDIFRYRDFLYKNKKNRFSEDDTSLILQHLILLRKSKLGARSRARHLVSIRGLYRFLIEEKIKPQASQLFIRAGNRTLAEGAGYEKTHWHQRRCNAGTALCGRIESI